MPVGNRRVSLLSPAMDRAQQFFSERNFRRDSFHTVLIIISSLVGNLLRFSMDEKIQEYEAFINEKLKADLRHVESRHEKILTQLSELQTLKNIIEKLENKEIPTEHLRLYSDLGCNFRVQAHVLDPCTMYIHIGLDVFVEMPLPQASKFIESRIKAFEKASDALNQAALQIKANIRLMLEGLRRMQNISPEEFPRREPSLW